VFGGYAHLRDAHQADQMRLAWGTLRAFGQASRAASRLIPLFGTTVGVSELPGLLSAAGPIAMYAFADRYSTCAPNVTCSLTGCGALGSAMWEREHDSPASSSSWWRSSVDVDPSSSPTISASIGGPRPGPRHHLPQDAPSFRTARSEPPEPLPPEESRRSAGQVLLRNISF
jgi:hypothetical protein